MRPLRGHCGSANYRADNGVGFAHYLYRLRRMRPLRGHCGSANYRADNGVGFAHYLYR